MSFQFPSLNVLVKHVPVCAIEKGECKRKSNSREFIDVNGTPQPYLSWRKFWYWTRWRWWNVR
jgi:hypothetical protein